MAEGNQRYIQLSEISDFFHVEIDVCRQFADFGLIRIIVKEDTPYVEPEEVPKLRHAIRLYRDLGINKEGIEVILSMRERIIRLQEEVDNLKMEVRRLEGEYYVKNIELPRKRGLFFEL